MPSKSQINKLARQKFVRNAVNLFFVDNPTATLNEALKHIADNNLFMSYSTVLKIYQGKR